MRPAWRDRIMGRNIVMKKSTAKSKLMSLAVLLALEYRQKGLRLNNESTSSNTADDETSGDLGGTPGQTTYCIQSDD